MPDILDRTVTITLRAVSDAYNSSIQAAAKSTDAALQSITDQVAAAGKGFEGLSTTVAASGTAVGQVATSASALNASLETTTRTLTENAEAAAAAAVKTQQVATSAASAATAETAAATATQQATTAHKSQADAAADASKKVNDAAGAVSSLGAKAKETGDAVKESGSKTGFASGLFSGLKDKAVELVPSLGSVFEIATGVATGLGELEIAKQVGSWLLDIGTKALESSGQLDKINETANKVKDGFTDLVGHGVQLLASAFTATIGPAVDQLVTGLTEGMKWLKALADWFVNSGTAGSVFSNYLKLLATLWAPVIDAVKDLWAKLQENFGAIQKFLQEHQDAWRVVATAIAGVVALLVTNVQMSLNAVGLVIKGVVWLVQQQFKLFADGISLLVDTASFLWAKLKSAVSAVGDFFRDIFTALPRPIQDAFAAIAQAIADWVRPIFDFIGGLIQKIPGLQIYKSTFDSVSSSIASFGKTVADGTAKQKEANDAADAAKQKAAELAKAQQALGVMTADQAAAAVKAASEQAAAFTKLVDSHTQNITQLTQAAKKAYADLSDTRQKIEASGTAQQKAALDSQIKNIQNWAAANHIALTDVQQAVAAIPAAFNQLDQYLQKIGFVSKDSVIKAANDAGQAWDTFFDRTSHGAEETAQFIQLQYTQLDKQIDQARQAGFTNEVLRLEQLQKKVADTADKNGIKLKELQQAFDAVNKSIQALVPATDAADKAIAVWTDDALQATRKQIDGMDLIKVATDQMVKSQLNSITNGYQQQLALAGDNAREQVEVAQKYYALLKDQIEQYGKYYTQEQRDQVQAALQSQLAIVHANGTTLEETKAQTKAATADQAESWTNLAKNMGQAMKRAASEMADALVNGDKSFGQVMKDMLKSLEKAFIQTFIKTGLDAVTQFVTKAFTGEGGLIGALGSVEKSFAGLGSKIGSLFSSGGGAAASAAGNLPLAQIPSGLTSLGNLGGGAASAASGAASGISSAIGSIAGAVNIVGTAVSAITGVISLFQERGQTKVLENIQQYLGLIYGQLLSVVAPTLQSGLMNIANYELKVLTGFHYQLHDWFQGWFGSLGSLVVSGSSGQLLAALAADTQAVVGAIQALGAAFGVVTIAGGFDPIVKAVQAAQAAIVAAIQAGATATSQAFGTAGFDPIVSAVNTTGAAVVDAINSGTQTLEQAFSAAAVAPGAGAADTGDFSAITGLLVQVRDALSQGSLRPNVQLNVEAGATPQEVAQTIVQQLQLAGVMR